MTAIEMKPGSWWIGVNIRSHDLFEGLWPIPHGVSLNSYLVCGRDVALIDLVREWSGSARTYLDQIESTGVRPSEVRYLILNHLEPDHTDFINTFRRIAPGVEILSTPKGIEMAGHLFGISEGVRTVQDGEELDLGEGKKLVFYHTPFVHWPETMVTYEADSGILYSCDAFGGFGALKGILFDDQVQECDSQFYYDEMLRYYANIVANFARPVQNAIKKLAALQIAMVAPSHGLVWRAKPAEVIERYARFAGYSSGAAERGITLIWSSMYGNTKTAVDAVMRGIASENVPIDLFEVPTIHESYILASIFKNRGIAVGAPTYEVGLFPPMAHLLDSAERKHMRNKKAIRFGSFGWSGGAQKEFDALAESLQWEQKGTLEFRGAPTPEQLQEAQELGAAFARSIRDED